MKKKLLSLTLIAILAFNTTAFAYQPNTQKIEYLESKLDNSYDEIRVLSHEELVQAIVQINKPTFVSQIEIFTQDQLLQLLQAIEQQNIMFDPTKAYTLSNDELKVFLLEAMLKSFAKDLEMLDYVSLAYNLNYFKNYDDLYELYNEYKPNPLFIPNDFYESHAYHGLHGSYIDLYLLSKDDLTAAIVSRGGIDYKAPIEELIVILVESGYPESYAYEIMGTLESDAAQRELYNFLEGYRLNAFEKRGSSLEQRRMSLYSLENVLPYLYYSSYHIEESID